MTRRRGLILALAAGAVLSGAGAAVVPAEAGGPASGHRGHLGGGRSHQGHHARPFVNPFYPPAGQNVHAAPYSVVPPTAVRVGPWPVRWVPGQWVQVWVPTFASVDVWVPDHYGPGGVLFPGQWASQTVESGYYDTVWVNGHWAR
jgi:hypothetical protein